MKRFASDRIAAGLVLAGTGVTMVSCNVWHDVHAGMPGYLAWLAGFAPVVTAMGLSLAIRNRHIALKIAAAAVMIGAMGLSLEAAGTMVRPAFGPLWWLFGPVGDLAALIAFHVIVTPAPVAEAIQGAMTGAVPEAADNATGSAIAEAAAEPSAEPPAVPRREPSAEPLAVPRRTDKSREAEQGRAAYRRSVRTGQPLSDRALGEMFGKSRTWGASRIREAEAGPHPVGRTA